MQMTKLDLIVRKIFIMVNNYNIIVSKMPNIR